MNGQVRDHYGSEDIVPRLLAEFMAAQGAGVPITPETFAPSCASSGNRPWRCTT